MANSNDNTDKISLNRIAIPVPIVYSHVFPNNGILFGGLGPQFHVQSFRHTAELLSKWKINFSGDSAQMQRFDVGLDIQVGYQFANGLSLVSSSMLGSPIFQKCRTILFILWMLSDSRLAGCLGVPRMNNKIISIVCVKS